jgi:hypothetical protein
MIVIESLTLIVLLAILIFFIPIAILIFYIGLQCGIYDGHEKALREFHEDLERNNPIWRIIMADKMVDLYLWVIPNNDVLYKIGHLSFTEATECSVKWFEKDANNDYMIVTEDSTPWSEPKPTIIEKDISFLDE